MCVTSRTLSCAAYQRLDQVGDAKVDKLVKFDTPDEVKAFLDTFYERGGRHLDTSRNYSPSAQGSSEPRLGAADAGSRFNIDTKILGVPGNGPFHTAAQIKSSIDASVADLKLPDGVKVDIMYLHIPDRDTPLEETCEAMNQAYQEGKFKRFGISNYTADEVEQIVAICKNKGYVAPTVYQGQYNPLVRSGEDVLFPVLRKHDIAFYAYSPAAAGVFVGNQKTAQSGSRFDSSVSGALPPYSCVRVGLTNLCATSTKWASSMQPIILSPRSQLLRITLRQWQPSTESMATRLLSGGPRTTASWIMQRVMRSSSALLALPSWPLTWTSLSKAHCRRSWWKSSTVSMASLGTRRSSTTFSIQQDYSFREIQILPVITLKL